MDKKTKLRTLMIAAAVLLGMEVVLIIMGFTSKETYENTFVAKSLLSMLACVLIIAYVVLKKQAAKQGK